MATTHYILWRVKTLFVSKRVKAEVSLLTEIIVDGGGGRFLSGLKHGGGGGGGCAALGRRQAIAPPRLTTQLRRQRLEPVGHQRTHAGGKLAL